jgi:hypothetical protein
MLSETDWGGLFPLLRVVVGSGPGEQAPPALIWGFERAGALVGF